MTCPVQNRGVAGAGVAGLLLCCLTAAVPRVSPAAEKRGEDGVLVYVGTYQDAGKGGIHATRLDPATGALAAPVLAASADRASYLALHPDRRHLYAVNELERFGGQPVGAVSAYEIASAGGALRLLGQVSSGGAGPCHVSTDRAGKLLFVANYVGGSVAAIPIRPDGSLAPTASVVRHEGRGSDPARQAGPHAHGVALDPAGGLLWAADLGLDRVLGYGIDAAGRLVAPAASTATLAPGAGPRHFTFSADGRSLFVLAEMASAVTVFRMGEGAPRPVQTVSTLPASVRPGPAHKAAALRLHPSGRFLYASNRGLDTIAVFSVAPTGALALVDAAPTGGRSPRDIALDPSGRFLVVANEASDELTVLRVDPATGRLSATGSRVRVGAPAAVLFVPPP